MTSVTGDQTFFCGDFISYINVYLGLCIGLQFGCGVRVRVIVRFRHRVLSSIGARVRLVYSVDRRTIIARACLELRKRTMKKQIKTKQNTKIHDQNQETQNNQSNEQTTETNK